MTDKGMTPPDADELAAARNRHYAYNDRDASTLPPDTARHAQQFGRATRRGRPLELPERIVRLLADAERLALDLRDARNAAPLGRKTELRNACRRIEDAAAIIRKAGL